MSLVFPSRWSILLTMLGILLEHWRTGRSFFVKPLAEMIGTTRSRVSYFMNKFRKRWTHQLQWKDRGS